MKKKQLQIVSQKDSTKKPMDRGATIGIDLGDQWSHYCVLNESGEIVEEGRFRTTPEALTKHFDGLEKARIAMEAGTHSIWINEKPTRATDLPGMPRASRQGFDYQIRNRQGTHRPTRKAQERTLAPCQSHQGEHTPCKRRREAPGDDNHAEGHVPVPVL